MPSERNNNIKYVRLNNQNSFLRALPEKFTYLVVTHCIIRFILKFLILLILSYLSKSAHPRTSKKHGKG
jgi:tetratricopeptide (TPR) repeat protein